MPNHVSQRIVITGPTEVVNNFRRVHFVLGHADDLQQSNENLNERLLHQQQQLATEDLDAQQRATVETRVRGIQHRIQENLALIDRIAAGELGDNFDLSTFVDAPEFIFQGGLTPERANDNRRNWYYHNSSRWGTKWNAYSGWAEEVVETEPGVSTLTFGFATAWSTPDPIYEMLGLAWPDLNVTVAYIDEGWNFWGVRQMHDGVTTDRCYERFDDDIEALQLLAWLERNLRDHDQSTIDEFFGENESANALMKAENLSLETLGTVSPFDN